MNKVYSRTNWENEPSTKTPLNEHNLNKIDFAVDEIDNRVIELDATKAKNTDLQTLSTRVDNLILNAGDSSVEAADARVTEDGTVYDTLKNRLDAEHSNVTSDISQLSNDIATILGGNAKINYVTPVYYQGGFIDRNGEVDTFTPNEYYTDYIPIKANSFILAKACVYEDRRIAIYDSDKNFIKVVPNASRGSSIDSLKIVSFYMETDCYIRMSLGLNWGKKFIVIESVDEDSLIGLIESFSDEDNEDIVLNVGDSKEFTTLRSAIEKIQADYKNRNVIINLYNSIDVRNEYTDAELLSHDTFPNSYYLGIILPKNTKLIGRGKNITISLNWDSERNESHNNELSILNVCGDFEVENITFTGTNLRYLIHQDGHADKTSNMHAYYKNCIFDCKMDTGSGVGVGIANGSSITFDDCTFMQDKKGNWLLNGHMDTTTLPATIICNRCNFIGNVRTIMEFGKMGDTCIIDNTIVLNDCYCQSPIDMAIGLVEGLNIIYKGSNNIGARPTILSPSLVEDFPYSYFQIGCISALNATDTTITKYKPLQLGANGIELFSNEKMSKFYGISMEDIESGCIGIVNINGNIPLSILSISGNIGDYIGISESAFVIVDKKEDSIGKIVYDGYLSLN